MIKQRIATWLIDWQSRRFKMGDKVRWREGNGWARGTFMAAQTGYALIMQERWRGGLQVALYAQVPLMKVRKAR